MDKDELLEWFDFASFQDSLGSVSETHRRHGLNLYVEMIGEVLRCISELEGGQIIEIDEIRDFLDRPSGYLTCENGVCEITIRKHIGRKGFTLHSVRFLDIYSAHRSYTVH